MSHKGFTLIEMLIVILIIAITSSVVAPVAYKSVEKFDKLISIAKKRYLEKEVNFLSFISDSRCRLIGNKIVCGNMNYVLK